MYRKKIFLAAIIGLTVLTAPAIMAQSFTPTVGEILEYKVVFKSMIKAGTQTIKSGSKSTFQGREVIEIISKTVTVGKFSETERILLDTAGLYPHYIYREVRDAEKLRIEEVTFDYSKNLAFRVHSKNNQPKKSEQFSVPGPVQDGLSLQFYLRQANLAPGSYRVPFYSRGEVEDTVYNVSQVPEQLKLDCGTFKGYFQVDHLQSGITLLIANTPEHWPLVIRKNANYGKIEVKLQSYQ